MLSYIVLQGVCVGLSEVMGSAGKSQLLNFMDELIPTIRTALCDRFGQFTYDLIAIGFIPFFLCVCVHVDR